VIFYSTWVSDATSTYTLTYTVVNGVPTKIKESENETYSTVVKDGKTIFDTIVYVDGSQTNLLEIESWFDSKSGNYTVCESDYNSKGTLI